MPKPGGGHSSGISLGDALRLPKRHPAWRRREAQPGSCMERENLAGDGKGKGASGSNREAESTDAPERGGLPRSSDRAMRANPDGHTILMGHLGTHAVSVSLYPNLAYKPETDFEPIGVVIELPLMIATRKDFPAKDLKEFVAYAKANADKLNMAHAGV